MRRATWPGWRDPLLLVSPRPSRTAARPASRFAVGARTAGFRETGGGRGARSESYLNSSVRRDRCAPSVRPQLPGPFPLDPGAVLFAAFGSVADETGFPPRCGVRCAFQSGGFGYAIVNLAEAQGVDSRYCVSSATRPTLAMPELLSAFLDDPGTSLAFAIWKASLRCAAAPRRRSQVAGDGQAVLIWKAGTTDAGIKAAASHTATMKGTYDLYRAAIAPELHHRGGRRRAHRRPRQAVRAGAPAEGQLVLRCCHLVAVGVVFAPMRPCAAA